MSANELRIVLAVIGAIALALIYYFGQPQRPRQGRRASGSGVRDGQRVEPTLGETGDGAAEAAAGDGESAIARSARDAAAADPDAGRARAPGARPPLPIERIVTLFVAARAGELIHGPDLVVAADKAGLQFGDLAIFHRLVPGKADAGPVFSMANMVKPGSFDLRHIEELHTPGVSLFMTLPGPVPALDAWEAMLPTAQRLAELLDGTVLDEDRNPLGRQRIAHIRDELRAWDRQQERQQVRPR
jgi:cell division protein ZipA